jgi:hypothetical protein
VLILGVKWFCSKRKKFLTVAVDEQVRCWLNANENDVKKNENGGGRIK